MLNCQLCPHTLLYFTTPWTVRVVAAAVGVLALRQGQRVCLHTHSNSANCYHHTANVTQQLLTDLLTEQSHFGVGVSLLGLLHGSVWDVRRCFCVSSC